MFGHLITPTFWDFSCRLPTGAARLRAARPLGVLLVACDYLVNNIMLFSQMRFVMKPINRDRTGPGGALERSPEDLQRDAWGLRDCCWGSPAYKGLGR